jgi:xanthosine utilization system XapX-like protein
MIMQIFNRSVNAPIVFVLIGLLAGALVGYATIPVERSAIRLGPIDIETQGKKPSVGDELTNAQTQHVLTIVLIGGLIGLGCGFAVQRRTRI